MDKSKLYDFCRDYIGTWFYEEAEKYDDPMDFCDSFFYQVLNEVLTEFCDLDDSYDTLDDVRFSIYAASAVVWEEATA